VSYYQLRRQELLGNRTRKLYRNSAAVRERLHIQNREDAMQAAIRRLGRLWR
jgi:hypothetical protein